MKPPLILGISSGHGDSAAAIVRGHDLIAAAEEERFSRIKHSAAFPRQSIAYCLEAAGVTPEEVDVIAVAHAPRANWWQKARFVLQSGGVREIASRFLERRAHRDLATQLDTEYGFTNARLHRVEHHLGHMLSARVLAPESRVALLSFDGLGDFASAATGLAENHYVRFLTKTYFPHSLGYFYTAMTQFLGFPHFGDEYKVMGLASFGRPTYLSAMQQLVRTHPGGKFSLNLAAFPVAKLGTAFAVKDSRPTCAAMYEARVLEKLLGLPPRLAGSPLLTAHEDLARSIQTRFEEVAAHILCDLHARTQVGTLGLAGGCAHNSVFVGKIPQLTPFTKVYVAPAAGDAGLAIGAAVSAITNGQVTPASGHWGLLGADLAAAEYLPPPKSLPTTTHSFATDSELVAWLVEELVAGKIIGLARGRMEFGPRALGSRSIIGDPRQAGMKTRLNALVKHRETFRPFAASVLCGEQGDWFENAFASPYMEAVFQVKTAKRAAIPAVTHVDGSCRIQSVSADTQPFYYALIKAFAVATGVPMLVNTSFNDHEPIVRTAAEALACFSRGGLDHVVIGTRVVTRPAAGAAAG